jgi:hypothetical protein
MSKTKIHRQLEEQRKRDLQVLAQLSRDVDASLRGPQKVKLVIPPMYVPEYTKSQGDSEYASNIRAFGAKQLQRSFGANKGALNVQQDVQIELQRAYGRGTALKPYVDLCTQVIMHLIIQGATNFDNGSDDPEILKNAKTLLVEIASDSDKGIVEALKALNEAADIDSVANIFKDNVYAWLYPISRSHISAVEAEAKGIIEKRDGYIAFVANADAQSAVLSYLLKDAPSAEVLLPAAIGGATVDLVKDALKAYPEKDLITTYNYYRKAVDASYDTESGIRTGDVDASLKAACSALADARSALRLTGIDADTTSIFAKAFSDVEDSVRKISPKSGDAKDRIEMAALDLADVLGLFNNFGETAAAYSATNAYGITTLRAPLLALAKVVPSKFERMLDDDNIEYLDARELVRPSDITIEARTKPNLAKVKNAVGLALLSLEEAHSELSTFMGFAPSALEAVPSRKIEVTPAFKALVKAELKAVLTKIEAAGSAVSANMGILKRGVDEALMQILSLPAPTTGSSYLQSPFETAGDAITDATFNQIADGTLPSLGDRTGSGRTVIEAVEFAVEQAARSSARTVTANVRRVTRDAALRAAKQIEIALQGIRIQALNTGIQIRQNPSDGGFHTAAVVGMGVGVLVGDHAVTALINRAMTPNQGSMKAHLVDTLPSVATAAVGAYLSFGKSSSEKKKQVGHALIGGALSHIVARYVAKIPSVRFSENAALKYTIQAIANAPANMLGDLSMGPSALTPANAQKEKGHLGEYVCGLVRTNSYEALCHIAVQLWKSGMQVEMDDDGVKYAVGEAPKASLADVLKCTEADMTSTDAAVKAKCGALINLVMTVRSLCGLKCANGLGIALKCDKDLVLMKLDEKATEALEKSLDSHSKANCNCVLAIAGVAEKDAPLWVKGCTEPVASNADAVAASINKLMSDTVLTAAEATALVEAVIADARIEKAKRDALAAKKEEVIAALQVKGSDGHLDKAKLAPLTACVVTETGDENVPVSPNRPAGLGGFILEPGYQDMRVYSGEDHVSYLQPRPYETAQAGYVQLDEAIARARQLTPYEKHQEGLGDLQGMIVVRLNPHDAQRAEAKGCGVCMGMSRVVPNTEVFAVEGDNTQWPTHPTPQLSVPQGDLNYPRIGAAESLDVSPTGLFTRGVFQPSYGRK